LPTFPRMRASMGGRFVPAVMAWLEQHEEGIMESAKPTNEERAALWEQSGRRRRKAVGNKEE